ncbi:MAG: PARP-type zinc finger-containing protein [Pseudomonadales bacterium]
MAHVIEPAASGRSKCRGCGEPIAKGELRLGERLPNPFADGEMTFWYHLICAAYKRPETLLEAVAQTGASLDNRETLEREAQRGIDHRRLPRINGVHRAPSARARCRSCREPITKDTWRIPLVFFEEDQFNAAGFVHASCCLEYFETTDVIDRLKHYSSDLSADDLAQLRQELAIAR